MFCGGMLVLPMCRRWRQAQRAVRRVGGCCDWYLTKYKDEQEGSITWRRTRTQSNHWMTTRRYQRQLQQQQQQHLSEQRGSVASVSCLITSLISSINIEILVVGRWLAHYSVPVSLERPRCQLIAATSTDSWAQLIQSHTPTRNRPPNVLAWKYTKFILHLILLSPALSASRVVVEIKLFISRTKITSWSSGKSLENLRLFVSYR